MSHDFANDPRRAEAMALEMAGLADRLAIQGLKHAGHELVGPCPKCGGTDRFGINKRKNVFQCRTCEGKGGNIDLVMFVLGVEFKEALEWICGPATGLSDAEREERIRRADENRRRQEERSARERERAIQMAWDAWSEGKSPEGTPVRDYLVARGIRADLFPRLPPCLRYHPDLPFTLKIDGEWTIIHRGPAMLAAIQRPDNRFTALHRTWLDLSRPKGKAVILDPRTGEHLPSKKVIGSKKGGAIRLTPFARTLVMAEGIETTCTALIAGMGDEVAYWAGVDLGNMSGQRVTGPGKKFAGIPDMSDRDAFVPPPDVERLIFIQDGDSDPRLTRAKLTAGLRRAMLLRPGLKGQIVHAGQGVDLNDVLMGEGA